MLRMIKMSTREVKVLPITIIVMARNLPKKVTALVSPYPTVLSETTA